MQKNNIPFYARQVFGEILFGLTYLPTAQRLSFSVIKATNLRYEEVGVEKTEEFRKFKSVSSPVTIQFIETTKIEKKKLESMC